MAGTDGSAPAPSSIGENTSNSSIDLSKDPARKAKSKDPGWKYGYWPDLANKHIVRCSLCGRDCNQGIKRLKQHLAGGFGDIAKCPKVSVQISREMHDFMMKNKKRTTFDLDDPMDHSLNTSMAGGEEGQVQISTEQESVPRVTPSSGTIAKRKHVLVQQQTKGPLDAFMRRNPEELVDERRDPKKLTQTTMQNRFRSAEQKNSVDDYVATWFYNCGIPFNVVRSRDFEVMLEAVAQYGSGYRPPSYHQLRVPLLKSAKEKVAEMKKNYEMHWKKYGCTLMSDGWTDRRGRHLINFLVNCPQGTYFMESVDASQHKEDANLLFQLLDKKIEEIGEEHVVQVVTDNASNYKAAGKLLMDKRPHLYWTPCAAHCIDLMLEDIGNLKIFKTAIAKGRRVTAFIYRHTRLLEAMRARTGGSELIRAGVTRFATSFLTLQSMLKNKDALKQLFVSDDWMKSNLSKTEIGMKVAETILSTQFWNNVQDCLRASQPLVIVLRLVDGDEYPAMPEVYLAMEEAKKRIQVNFGDKGRLWKKVVDIIDKRWECQMGRPLYIAALFLNPGKFFEYTKDDFGKQGQIQKAFNEVLTRMVPDLDLQDKISKQASSYKDCEGAFGMEMAIRQRNQVSPCK